MEDKGKGVTFINRDLTIRLSKIGFFFVEIYIPEVDSRVKSLLKFFIDSSVVMILILTPRHLALVSAFFTSFKLNVYKARQIEFWL